MEELNQDHSNPDKSNPESNQDQSTPEDDMSCLMDWHKDFGSFQDILLFLNKKKCYGVDKDGSNPHLRVMYLEKEGLKKNVSKTAFQLLPIQKLGELVETELTPLGVWTVNDKAYFAVIVDDLDEIVNKYGFKPGQKQADTRTDPFDELLKSLKIEKGGKDERE